MAEEIITVDEEQFTVQENIEAVEETPKLVEVVEDTVTNIEENAIGVETEEVSKKEEYNVLGTIREVFPDGGIAITIADTLGKSQVDNVSQEALPQTNEGTKSTMGIGALITMLGAALGLKRKKATK